MDIQVYIDAVENELQKCCDEYLNENSVVADAVRYSLLKRGKRVRAIFIFLTAEMCGKDWKDYLRLACGIEMIHCYSLIHDDMPCMDNDDYRRGKLSNHKVYGEAVAMLRGDALAGLGLETIANCDKFPAEEIVNAVKETAKAMGPRGMVYGQELDLKYENTPCDRETLNTIHRNKTGAMISLCGKLGALGCNLTESQMSAVELFFANNGLVFQIVDDILDVEGDAALLGKPVGSDEENEKTTFVKLYGLEKSKEIAQSLADEAKNKIFSAFGYDSSKLIEYTESLLHRNK